MATVDTFGGLTIRTQQGTDSPTWTRPGFYGGSTIPELYEFHAEHSPDHPVIIYQDGERTTQTLRFKDVFRAARKVASTTLCDTQKGSPGSSSSIIGILASLGVFTLTFAYSVSHTFLRLPYVFHVGPRDHALWIHPVPDIRQKLSRCYRRPSAQDLDNGSPCEPRPGDAAPSAPHERSPCSRRICYRSLPDPDV